VGQVSRKLKTPGWRFVPVEQTWNRVGASPGRDQLPRLLPLRERVWPRKVGYPGFNLLPHPPAHVAEFPTSGELTGLHEPKQVLGRKVYPVFTQPLVPFDQSHRASLQRGALRNASSRQAGRGNARWTYTQCRANAADNALGLRASAELVCRGRILFELGSGSR
jgi:hypothetical protein